MLNTEILSTIFGLLAGSGALLAGMGFAYAQLKRGGSEADSKTIASLKEYIDTLEEKNKRLTEEKSRLINSHQMQLTELNKAIGVLQGRFDEQTKQLEIYKQLIQGRDPEHMQVLKEIKEALQRLDDKSENNQDRNKGIDEAASKVWVEEPKK